MVWLSIKQGMGEIEDWKAIRRADRMRRGQERSEELLGPADRKRALVMAQSDR
jgi:hypothetical protein